ncbi:hypothetical protein Tcan_18643 [Toxocara canis]|uniref:Uncharacterized protein n=1 Tax=Toxocara canis TaxID=6265 RepID=A0A0B2UYT5_TOXCA|nr:hypothetical protein Tcan_18643 [Toxocara canis]
MKASLIFLSLTLVCVTAVAQQPFTDEDFPRDVYDSPTDPYNAEIEKRSEADKKRLIPFSGGVYGKRSLPLDRRETYFKRGRLPLSGGLYGKRLASIPFYGGIYGKRAASLPFSGGLYGKRFESIPFSGGLYGKKALSPLQGGIYGKRAALPFSGGVYGKRASKTVFGQNRLSLRSVPMSGGFFG